MSDFDVYCGLDVGKGDHHAVALDKAGKRLHDAPPGPCRTRCAESRWAMTPLAELGVLIGYGLSPKS